MKQKFVKSKTNFSPPLVYILILFVNILTVSFAQAQDNHPLFQVHSKFNPASTPTPFVKVRLDCLDKDKALEKSNATHVKLKSFEFQDLDLTKLKYVEHLAISIYSDGSDLETIWSKVLELKNLKSLSIGSTKKNVKTIPYSVKLEKIFCKLKELEIYGVIISGTENKRISNCNIETLIFNKRVSSSDNDASYLDNILYFSIAKAIENLLVVFSREHNFRRNKILQSFNNLKHLEVEYYSNINESNVFDDLLVNQKIESISIVSNSNFCVRNISNWKSLSRVYVFAPAASSIINTKEVLSLPELTHLNVSFPINSEQLEKSTKLSHLSFSTKDIKSNTDFSKLENLESLHLHGSNLKQIPQTIYNLNKLKTLVIRGILITVLDEDINKLRSLRVLKVESRSNLKLPKYLSLNNLVELDLRCGSNIGEINENSFKNVFDDLTNLEQLRLWNFNFSKDQSHQVLESIISISNKKLNVELLNCSTLTFNGLNWKGANFANFEVKDGKIDSLPKSFILSDFEDLSIDVGDEGSYLQIRDVDMLKIYGYRSGKLSKEEVYQNVDIIDAINSNRFKHGEKYDFLKYCFNVDSLKADQELNLKIKANYHFKNGVYHDASKYFKQYIDETKSGYRVSNSSSSIKIHEYKYIVSCIKSGNLRDAEIYQDHIERTLDSLNIVKDNYGLEEDVLFDESFMCAIINNALKKHKVKEKYISICEGILNSKKELNQLDQIEVISLLELYLLTDQPEKFKALSEHAKAISWEEIRYRLIFEYFEAVYSISQNGNSKKYDELLSQKDHYQNARIMWKSKFVNYWALLNVSDEIYAKILNLNQLFTTLR